MNGTVCLNLNRLTALTVIVLASMTTPVLAQIQTQIQTQTRSQAQAQTQAQTQTDESWPELLCPIVSLDPNNGVYTARLACGSLDGVKASSRTGPPIRRYNPQTGASVSVLNAAEVSLQKVSYLDSLVQLTLAETETLSPGDLIPLEVKPVKADSQLLFRLSRLGIVFSNQEGVPWVLYRDYLQQPELDFDAERLPLMLAEVHEMAFYAPEVYGEEPLSEGYYAGKTLAEAMSGSQVRDLQDFLAFVQSFPGKYLGQRWKFPEVYATWLINGAPGPDDEDNEVIPDDVRPDLDPSDNLGYRPEFKAVWQLKARL